MNCPASGFYGVTLSTLTFQPKQFSAANLYGVEKMKDPSFQYNKKVIAQNTRYCLVSAIYVLSGPITSNQGSLHNLTDAKNSVKITLL